ncbi:MAG: hydroxyethylthiazole kinase [Candidatus Marinimicrobia bacterium]|nr:hydroxyethylthiazole kinase [Candidatus Neomarinimicrobiota bacterium]
MTEQNVGLAAWRDLATLRAQTPVVHSVTNFVVMNNTANALLALGAAPIMAQAPEEMEEMAAIANALVLNIGTLDRLWIGSFFAAIRSANRHGKPVVLDPVGAGASRLRTMTALDLLREHQVAILRGNPSEIMALAGQGAGARGVDAVDAPASALEAAQTLTAQHGCVVSISGPTDLIVGPDFEAAVDNGHPLMPRVTGLGCTASVLAAALAAVNPDPARAAWHAAIIMGLAGEIAAERAAGPGSLQMHFLDALYQLDEPTLVNRTRAGSRMSPEPNAGAGLDSYHRQS